MSNLCLTQMDLTRWFKSIEHLIGILNGINDYTRANNLTKSLIRSTKCFKSLGEYYLSHCDSYDVKVMLNRITIIIQNLKLKECLQTDSNVLINITFFELEKWKQGIMYKIGVLMAMSDSVMQNMFCKKILQEILCLTMYANAYLEKLKSDTTPELRKIHDLNILITQLINIAKNMIKFRT